MIQLVFFMFMFSKCDGSHSSIFVYNFVYFLIHYVISLSTSAVGDLSSIVHIFISLRSLLTVNNDCGVRLCICIHFGELLLMMCMSMNKNQGW